MFLPQNSIAAHREVSPEPLVPPVEKCNSGVQPVSPRIVSHLVEPLLWYHTTGTTGKSVGPSYWDFDFKGIEGLELATTSTWIWADWTQTCNAQIVALIRSFAYLQTQVGCTFYQATQQNADLPDLDPQMRFYFWPLSPVCPHQAMCWLIAPPAVKSPSHSSLTRKAGDNF